MKIISKMNAIKEIWESLFRMGENVVNRLHHERNLFLYLTNYVKLHI